MNNQWTTKKKPRCYTKSPSGEDMFRPIPGHISCTGVTGRCGLLPCAKKMVGLNHMACRSCPLKIISSIMIMCVCVCRSIRGTGGITTWTRLLYLQWGIKWSWKMLIAVYSLGRAWVNLTLVWLHYACVCIYACMLVCLDWPLTGNFKWVNANISRRSISWSSGELLSDMSECSVRDPEWWWLNLKHAWHWFVLLPTTAGCSQAVQI